MSAVKEYVAINRTGNTKSLSKGWQSQEHDPDKESKNNLIISFKHFEAALKKVKRNVKVAGTDLA